MAQIRCKEARFSAELRRVADGLVTYLHKDMDTGFNDGAAFWCGCALKSMK